MEILKETDGYVVCVKPAGVLSEEDGEKMSVPKLLREENGIDRVFSVHRLDREVGGVMIYAKNSAAAAFFSEAIAQRRMNKEYIAVVWGETPPQGSFEDLLFRDSRTMKTYVVRRKRAGVRDAKLDFVRIACAENGGRVCSLAHIRLHTGRTHQIRVQFAHRGLPLLGDGRYGSGDGKDRPALFSCRLALDGEFNLTALPRDGAFGLFDEETLQKAVAHTFPDRCG